MFAERSGNIGSREPNTRAQLERRQMIDPLVSLAHSLHSNKGVFALLLGSGLSRAASIPTGWEITLELIRRVAAAEGVEGHISHPEAWFKQTKGEDPNYSRILDQLAGTPEERRAILHGFVAPSPEDVQAGIKTPTTAHRAIAELAARGYIRVIVTTNFDRLMETALRDVGVEPTVIASPDDAAGAMPLMHCACVVLKLNGDYLDTRIRNTPAELAAYDQRLDAYLDRILDEFGLIIVGWSGEWDEALRAAIARCPTRRFTTWWAAIGGKLAERARDLADGRRAQILSIETADRLFSDIEQKILSLEELNRPHPLSVKLATAEIKRYLPDPLQRIRLYDLVLGEMQVATNQVGDLANQNPWSVAEFRRRVSIYEAASEIPRALAATGSHWCREDDEGLWGEAVRRLCLILHVVTARGMWVGLSSGATCRCSCSLRPG
jgi:SIR2-like domain